MTRSTKTLGAFTVLAWTAASGGLAYGQDSAQKTQIHGFGTWAYGRTSEPNIYLGATPEGSYDNARLALSAISEVSNRLSISSQVEFLYEGELEVELDYAFASWRFSDAFVLRAGAAKLPFGISSEVYDVGTARPFIDLAQAVYGPLGNVSERYYGIGFTGSKPSSEWGFRYDIYFGGLTIAEYEAPEDVLHEEEEGEEEEGAPAGEEGEGIETHTLRNVIGGRFVVETPLSGLSLGASVYTGDEDHGGRRTNWGAQAEYLEGPWSLRTEFVGGSLGDESRRSFYAEAARRFGAWQVAGRYDRFDTELKGPEEEDGGSLLRHESWTVGLNYWFSPEFVLKANYHRVDGNRLAGPPIDQLAELFEAGALEPKTDVFQFGAQFSF